MARLITCGGEVGVGGFQPSTSTSVLDTVGFAVAESTIVRVSGQSFKLPQGNTYFTSWSTALGRWYYVSAWFYFTSYPSSDLQIFFLTDTGGSSGGYAVVDIHSSGKIMLSDKTFGQIGSDSTDAVPLNQWAKISLGIQANSGNYQCALRLNNVIVVAPTLVSRNPFVSPDILYVSTVSPFTFYFDDVQINDDTGANENTWPGDEHIVLLSPTSDNAVGTGWVDGDGAGTLFGSVDNSPPQGATTPADGTQIKNLTSTATGNYDANMTTYQAAGVDIRDKVTVVQAACDHAERISTGTKAGALLIVSNPVQASEDTFNYGDDQGANGGWNNNWAAKWGTPQYNPNVTVTTAPVLRVGKRTATTREVEVDRMAIYVAYLIHRPPNVIQLSEGAMKPGAVLGVGPAAGAMPMVFR